MSPVRGRLTRLVVLCLPALLPAGALRGQQARPEVLRGRVVADSGGMPIAGVDVVVTVPPDRAELAATTDATGAFLLRVPRGTGDYLVHVNLLGWEPWRRRVTLPASDSVADVQIRLAAKAVALAPLAVQAERPRPNRGPELMPGTGSKEEVVAGVAAAVPPGLQGDLNAMAATIPGVRSVAGGISVLGLPPDQNKATLNGMAFGATDVPREARSWTRVSTSSFDPVNGGYAGAQLDVSLVPGSIMSGRRGHLTLDAPALQYNDPVAAGLGQRFTNLQGSLGGDGELIRDRFYYNMAGQFSHRSGAAASLLNAGQDLLNPAGIAADSVARFLQLIAGLGVPATAGAVGRLRTTAGSFIARIDHKPEAARSWGVTAYGKYASADAAPALLATPAHGGSARSGRAMLQAEHSVFFQGGQVNLARTAVSLATDRTRPALQLADGRVLVGSDATAGAGMSSLAFGGNAALANDVRSWTWETADELRLYNRNSKHKPKLFASSRLDGFSRDNQANTAGTYSYNSLADLAANRPATYARLLSAPRVTGGVWTGVLAAGDAWRRGKLSLLYGLRGEANRYTVTPAANPAVEAAFGARTDVAPNRLHVSPRLGFNYDLNPRTARQLAIVQTPVATRIFSSRGVLRGGIGEFRSMLSPTLLADATAATGLADASRRLLCVGPAVPVPDWSALAAGAAPADGCAAGVNGFVDAAPGIHLFDPAYDAARSWRANLGWSGTLLGLGVTLDGVYSLNRNQPGTVDLNFGGTTRFTLSDEQRPVYVSPAAIVPATGALLPVESRRASAFGRVLSHRSDLWGDSRQLTLGLTPGGGMMRPGPILSGAYTLAQTRTWARGFDGAAFGDPSRREYAPSDYDVRHQFQVQAGYMTRWLNFSLFATLRSGTPFTPLVAGDVNGDGVPGDRAFIYDPARTTDPALAGGMRALLASAPAGVRHCLEAGLGRDPGRNSCRTPWTSDLRGQISLGNRFPGAGRLNGSLNFVNPLGGIDQLLHGSGNLHGWGTAAAPDPYLYTVRGFDPAQQRFLYDVNPRFGDTRPSRNTFRSPFRVTLDFSVDLGKPMGQQQLERSLAPGRRLPERALRELYARNVPDIYDFILEQSDSLLLAPDQAGALKTAQAKYRQRMDSLWTDLAGYIAGLPEHYDGAAALKRQDAAVDSAWSITWKEGPTIKSILSPLQQRMMPQFVAMILNSKEVPRIRIIVNRR